MGGRVLQRTEAPSWVGVPGPPSKWSGDGRCSVVAWIRSSLEQHVSWRHMAGASLLSRLLRANWAMLKWRENKPPVWGCGCLCARLGPFSVCVYN